MLPDIVFVDLDNTVLTSAGAITPYTAEIFRDLKRRGTKLAILTTRILPTARGAYDELGADALAFSYGAGVMCGETEICRHELPWSDAREAIRAIYDTAHVVPTNVMYSDMMYTSVPREKETRLYSDLGELPERAVERILVKDALKFADSLALDETRFRVEPLEQRDIVIVSPRAGKLAGMRAILTHFGLENGVSLGFGDSAIDLEFLRACTRSVAVANAEDEVLRASDETCGSSDDDGVALYLSRL
jgi:HAD superfamily hydrolase (TIGR01484 family)